MKSVRYMNTAGDAVFFAPELYIGNGVMDISFYKNAFGAVEQLLLRNDDGSVHVAELSVEGAIFHIHEAFSRNIFFPPDENGHASVCIGLFVPDVDAVMKLAISAGATLVSAARDYEYGYRQGTVRDPFGHYWQIQHKNI
jgi:PhnB protein